MRHYSPGDWAADVASLYVLQGNPPACPSCGRIGFYGPRQADPDRRYRACKFCGFWQDVGEEPVPHRATVHDCDPWRQIAGADYIWWVAPHRKKYDCPYCDAPVEVEKAIVSRPVEDEDHPWWDVPQNMTFDEAVEFWTNEGRPGPHL